MGCDRCRSLHAYGDRLRPAIEAEKRLGKWKNATIDEAIKVTEDAQRSGDCVCACHQRAGDEG